MTSITGPYISQVVSKPLIVVEDSKKNAEEEAITLKIAGSYGTTEFDLDEIAIIHKTIGEFLEIKSVNPSIQAAAAHILRDGVGIYAPGTK